MKPRLGIGMTVGDEESFDLYKELLYPIISRWHSFDPYTQVSFRV